MKIRKTIGAAVLSLGLVVGLSGFAGASTGSITNTGPDSYNKVKTRSYHKVEVNNNNNLGVVSTNSQTADSGKAGVFHNTTGGSAKSGNATNANSTSVSASVTNSLPSGAWSSGGSGNQSGSINTTGPDSVNIVSHKQYSKVEVNNTNNVTVTTTNSQYADSGSAVVAGNTTGGSATSGSASNTNTSTTSLKITN